MDSNILNQSIPVSRINNTYFRIVKPHLKTFILSVIVQNVSAYTTFISENHAIPYYAEQSILFLHITKRTLVCQEKI